MPNSATSSTKAPWISGGLLPILCYEIYRPGVPLRTPQVADDSGSLERCRIPRCHGELAKPTEQPFRKVGISPAQFRYLRKPCLKGEILLPPQLLWALPNEQNAETLVMGEHGSIGAWKGKPSSAYLQMSSGEAYPHPWS